MSSTMDSARRFGLYSAIIVTTAAAVVLAWACTDTELDPITLDLGDPVVYRAEVQPYVGLRCGSLDCHGDSERALRIFAEHGLRESDQQREQPESDTEIAANTAAFAALASADGVDEHLALLKGLDPGAGGMGHVGDVIWQTRQDSGYLCVRAWLSGASDATACAAALAEVAIEE